MKQSKQAYINEADRQLSNMTYYQQLIPCLQWQKSAPARHGTAFFASVNVSCRAMPCHTMLADTLCESVLTRHGMAPLF